MPDQLDRISTPDATHFSTSAVTRFESSKLRKYYIDNLSEETRKGMMEKAHQGIWPSCAPLGYLNVVGPEGKRMIRPDPDMAPIISRLFERYATGKYSVRVMA